KYFAFHDWFLPVGICARHMPGTETWTWWNPAMNLVWNCWKFGSWRRVGFSRAVSSQRHRRPKSGTGTKKIVSQIALWASIRRLQPVLWRDERPAVLALTALNQRCKVLRPKVLEDARRVLPPSLLLTKLSHGIRVQSRIDWVNHSVGISLPTPCFLASLYTAVQTAAN